MCLCTLSHRVSELSQRFCAMTKQDLGCVLEARHPLVVNKVSQVGLRQTDKDDGREQNRGLIMSARVITTTHVNVLLTTRQGMKTKH